MVELNLFLPFNVLYSPVKSCYKMSKIEINNVYKIFGPNPKSVLPMVKDGASKEEILEKIINQLHFNYREIFISAHGFPQIANQLQHHLGPAA